MSLVSGWFRIPFWQRVLGAFVLGGLAGWLAGPAAATWFQPLGTLYVAAIKMIATPLVFFAGFLLVVNIVQASASTLLRVRSPVCSLRTCCSRLHPAASSRPAVLATARSPASSTTWRCRW